MYFWKVFFWQEINETLNNGITCPCFDPTFSKEPCYVQYLWEANRWWRLGEIYYDKIWIMYFSCSPQRGHCSSAPNVFTPNHSVGIISQPWYWFVGPGTQGLIWVWVDATTFSHIDFNVALLFLSIWHPHLQWLASLVMESEKKIETTEKKLASGASSQLRDRMWNPLLRL